MPSKNAPLDFKLLQGDERVSPQWVDYFNQSPVTELLSTTVLEGQTEAKILLHDTDKYSKFIIVFSDVTRSASAALNLQTSFDLGKNFDSASGDYRWTRTYLDGASAAEQNDNSSSTGTYIPLSGTDAITALSGNLEILSQNSNNTKTVFKAETLCPQTYPEQVFVTGQRDATNQTNAVRIYPASGSLESGYIILLGVKNRD